MARPTASSFGPGGRGSRRLKSVAGRAYQGMRPAGRTRRKGQRGTAGRTPIRRVGSGRVSSQLKMAREARLSALAGRGQGQGRAVDAMAGVAADQAAASQMRNAARRAADEAKFIAAAQGGAARGPGSAELPVLQPATRVLGSGGSAGPNTLNPNRTGRPQIVQGPPVNTAPGIQGPAESVRKRRPAVRG